MLALRLKRSKIATALTITSSHEEAENVAQWGKTIPRVLCMGSHEPPKFNGLKYAASLPNAPLKRLLSTYLMQIPGMEVCVISPPNLRIGGNQIGLLKYVDSMAYELAWGCNCDTPQGRLFVLSSAVIPHIMNDLSDKVTMEGSQWSDNLHQWLKLTLVHRYFDGTQYGIAEAPVVMNAYNLTPEPLSKPAEAILTPDPDPANTETPKEAEKPVKRKGRKKKSQ